MGRYVTEACWLYCHSICAVWISDLSDSEITVLLWDLCNSDRLSDGRKDSVCLILLTKSECEGSFCSQREESCRDSWVSLDTRWSLTSNLLFDSHWMISRGWIWPDDWSTWRWLSWERERENFSLASSDWRVSIFGVSNDVESPEDCALTWWDEFESEEVFIIILDDDDCCSLVIRLASFLVLQKKQVRNF